MPGGTTETTQWLTGKVHDITNVVHPDIGWSPAGVTSIHLASQPPASLGQDHVEIPAGTYYATSSVTFKPGVHVRIRKGALIKPAAGVTITFDTVPSGPIAKIFDLSEGGSIRFTNVDAPVWADWWGAAEAGSFQAGVQAACDAIWNNGAGAGVVKLSGRTYTSASTTTITCRYGTRIEGLNVSHHFTSNLGTVIDHTAASGWLFTFTSAGSQNVSKFDIRYIKIIGNVANVSGAISATGLQVSALEYLYVKSYTLGTGIKITSSVGNTIRGCRVQACKYDLDIVSNTTTLWVEENRFEDATTAGAAIHVINSDGVVVIRKNTIESNDGRGIHAEGVTYSLIIENNWFEGNSGSSAGTYEDIYLNGTAGNTIKCARVVGNRINSAQVGYGLRCSYMNDSVIRDNFFGLDSGSLVAHIALDANSTDNLCEWNTLANSAKYSDSGSRNIRNERNVVNELGTLPKLRGNMDLNSFLLRDTSLGGTPSMGWQAGAAEGVTTAPPASLRMITGIGSVAIKATGSGNTGWRKIPVIGQGWVTLADNTTPSVSPTASAEGGKLYFATMSIARNVTNFTNGLDGQMIYILPTNGNTTLVNGATIQTTTGANKTLTSGQVYKLVLNGTLWVEF